MKTKSIKYILAAGLVCCGLSTTLTSCSDVLDEQPRSQFDPTFFTTKAGIEGGLTSLYAHLRYFYGNGYYLNSLETGTDEYTYAQSADGNFKDADLSGVGSMTPNNSIAGGCWGTAFANINTASGIIENGAEAGMDASLLAEAYFFRGFDYFILVQTYGGVPLDLGAGPLKFNTSTVRTSVRNTVPEVYAAIFSDLEKAVADLPENPRLTGTATKNLARLYLSKAYMTYADRLDDEALFQALRKAKEEGIVIAAHCENDGVINLLRKEYVSRGLTAAKYHPLSRPARAEAEAVNRFLHLAAMAGDAPSYIVHLSSKEGLAEVMKARRERQQHVGVETCTQYLMLTDSFYEDPSEGLKAVMSPPLRRADDNEALWQALADGIIDVIGTDHCPFLFATQKQRGAEDFTLCPNGAPDGPAEAPVVTRLGDLIGLIGDRM